MFYFQRHVSWLVATGFAVLGLFVLGWVFILADSTPTPQNNCTPVYNSPTSWRIEMCATDPNIPTPMNIVLDDVELGEAALVRFSHASEDGSGQPQVIVVYASGYVRLKQNADPLPPVPFGTSFVLGPAYWSDASTYHHNPQLTKLDINTGLLPGGPIRMTAFGTNSAFDVSYQLVLPTPRDRQNRLHVSQTYTATTAVSIDATRISEHQGFKLVQFSSMFINESGSCDGGHTDCHDSNALRFIDQDLQRRQRPFTAVTPSNFILTQTTPLGSTWVDVLHTDDNSWQGNTPNTRIALDSLPDAATITPQGWIESTSDPDDDNVGVWLHDDNPASHTWTTGQSGQISYWLLAQDNPPDPWADLGLRFGWTFLDFESNYNCQFVKDSGQSTIGTMQEIAGYRDTAVELNYDLGNTNGNWAQIRCDFSPPLDLSAYDHLRFDWRGDPDAANSLEIGVINPNGTPVNIFGRGYHHTTHRQWWGQMVIPFDFLAPWQAGTEFDPSQVSAIFFSVVKDPQDDVGGNGRFAIDNLNAFNLAARTIPTAFATVESHDAVQETAVNWLAAQQYPSGLLKSWPEQTTCLAHTYDQALALLVFIQEGRWTEADAIVSALAVMQNGDGSWFKTHLCDTNPPIAQTDNKWEGDIAWAIYALSHYLALGGTHPQAETVRNNAASWLATRINPADGCLLIDHTEGTIDAWWALQSAWPNYTAEKDGLKSCLLTYYWDEEMGRFKGGRDWWQPYLDNQTWGAAFLKAIGHDEDALRALSYAYPIFLTPAQGGQGYGMDGQAGPWSVWNEGTGQYIAVGGPNSQELLDELLAQQHPNGALPGSFDDFYGGGVWTTRWTGVAPTSWMIFALEEDAPFYPQIQQIFLPVIVR